MITATDLRAMAAEKLKAAKTLLTDHPQEAAQLVGYAVEIQLKARITEYQRLTGWPEHPKEFKLMKLRHLRTHQLHDLLVESGHESYVKSQLMAEWSLCVTWNPESRYAPSGTVTAGAAQAMLEAADELLRHL